MFAISRILCPVDLSDPSKSALRLAFALARQHHATVRVVQVFDPGFVPDGTETVLAEVTPATRAALDEALNWFVAPIMDPGVTASVHLREGPAVPAILAEASLIRADLIVVGRHGRGGFQRLALGSVAEKVLRMAGCPVLCVPHDDRHAVPLVIRRVLCPTDFSPAARAATEYARFLAMAAGAALMLVSVVEWPLGETTAPDAVTTLRRSIEAEAEEQLQAAAAAGGLPTETFVLRGKPWREITAFARSQRVELIVMGTSGRGAFDLTLLGSTTHHVVRDAPCPVLAVHAAG